MALIQKLTGQPPEVTTELNMVTSLEESGDVEQKNVIKSCEVVFIEGQFRHTKDLRFRFKPIDIIRNADGGNQTVQSNPVP